MTKERSRKIAIEWIVSYMCASLFMALTSAPVRCDLTVTTQMSVTGIATDPDQTDTLPSFPIKSTIYFHGDKSRLETSAGDILIFDNDSGKVFQIDGKAKTYRVEPIDKLIDLASILPENMSSFVNITEDLTLDQSTDVGEYFNNLALRTDVTGEAIFEPKRSEGEGHRREGDGGGGGGGGGDGGGHLSNTSAFTLQQGGHGPGRRSHEHPPMGMHLPMLDISGSLWETHAVVLPKERHEIVLPIVLQMVWGGSAFVSDLVDQLDKNHQIPLHSVMTVSLSYPNRSGDNAPIPVPVKTTTTYDVLSVTDGPLADSLFAIPDGFAKEAGLVTLPQLSAPSMGHMHVYGGADSEQPGTE